MRLTGLILFLSLCILACQNSMVEMTPEIWEADKKAATAIIIEHDLLIGKSLKEIQALIGKQDDGPTIIDNLSGDKLEMVLYYLKDAEGNGKGTALFIVLKNGSCSKAEYLSK